jgi:hypothetical protein
LDLRVLGDDLMGYTHVTLMTEPIVKCNSLVAVVRISSSQVANTRLYILRIGLKGEEALSIVDSIWLNRYAGNAIDRGLECYGLVGGDSDHGCVVYVGFGPPRGDGGGVSVTISAIHFGAVDSEEKPRVADLDLFQHVVPSVVCRMSYNSTSGGCVFLASSGLLGGALVRFPRIMALASTEDEITEGAGQENVLAIKSHLLSAFQQFVNKLRGGNGNHAAVARSVVPPSIESCSSFILSSAVVMASQDLATNQGGRSGLLSPSFRTPSPVAALREKLQLHTDFVNFLLYAGVYRKISTTGRIKLRDHGEMIDATQACLAVCQGMMQKLDDSATDQARREELSSIRHVLNRALDGIADNVLELPSRWASLQQASTDGSDGRDLFSISSFMICNGIGSAFRYRQGTLTLYDIPSCDSAAESSSAPWTSSVEVLEVLQIQLENIDISGKAFLDNSTNLEEDTVILRQLVEDMSATLLMGHRDIVMRDASNVNACQVYESKLH